MKDLKTSLFLAASLLLGIQCQAVPAKNTILGCPLTPANTPRSSDADIRNFFDLARQTCSHVIWIIDWKDSAKSVEIAKVLQVCHVYGLRLHVQLSPLSIENNRRNPSIPANVKGKSFADPAVRVAFRELALDWAALHPDQLALGTEVNFLAFEPAEFKALVSLFRETYSAIKKKFPKQEVTVSFQWDVMRSERQFAILKEFADCLDVYSFTSYPEAVKDPGKLPQDYYALIRTYLPRERICISEIGWSTVNKTESVQARFFQRLPQLLRGLKMEGVALGLMHDVNVFTGDLAFLNHVGVRYLDGRPKPSWKVIEGLTF
jgi:hypothetical protein